MPEWAGEKATVTDLTTIGGAEPNLFQNPKSVIGKWLRLGKPNGMRRMKDPNAKQTARRAEAEAVAIAILGYLGRNPDHLGRFLAETGIGPGQLRGMVQEPGFLVGLLEFVLADESLLLAFAESEKVRPTAIAIARHELAGPDGDGG